jgi:hypothetical protein
MFTYPVRLVQGRTAKRLVAVGTVGGVGSVGGVGRVIRRVDNGTVDRPDSNEPMKTPHIC